MALTFIIQRGTTSPYKLYIRDGVPPPPTPLSLLKIYSKCYKCYSKCYVIMLGLLQVLDLLQVLSATILLLLLLLLNKAYRALYLQINMLYYSAITYIKNNTFNHMLQ